MQHDRFLGERTIHRHAAFLESNREALFVLGPFGRKRRSLYGDEKRPYVEQPVGSRQMGHLHVRGSFVQPETGTALIDGLEVTLRTRNERNLRPVREPKQSVVGREGERLR